MLNPAGRAIDRLRYNALLDTGIDPAISPASCVRAEAKQAERRATGEFKTVASIEAIKNSKGVYADVLRRIHPEKSLEEEGSLSEPSDDRLTKSFPTVPPMVQKAIDKTIEHIKQNQEFVDELSARSRKLESDAREIADELWTTFQWLPQ